ncbi:Dynactin subunit 6 [Trichuris trichiura]|uniref:Dynactin subunit 6 n=1 Tax=Trichuris trichiura TaxID=36087 RepID=A0A077Z7Z4_TRITR|nr:Dynactin subunit 6 [Trichuris trichiura]
MPASQLVHCVCSIFPVGPGTVVQSFAKILALGGPIVIGKDNVIEEFACIVNKRRDATMSIGNRNIFEIGCCKYHVELTKRCTIGTQITLQTSEILEENTVVYGSSEKRLMGSTLPRLFNMFQWLFQR